MYLLKEWFFLVFLFCLALAFWSFLRLMSVKRHYGHARNSRGLCGSDIAKGLLEIFGLTEIEVRLYPGELTDHYDTRDRIVHLSSVVYDDDSLLSAAVAAHEVGHAVQDSEGRRLYRVRNALVPVANILSYVAIPLFAFGLLTGIIWLTHLGEYLFIVVVLFHTLTLPVEIEAGRRVLRAMTALKMLAPDELDDVSECLYAIALTYISVTFTAIFHLTKLIVLSHKE